MRCQLWVGRLFLLILTEIRFVCGNELLRRVLDKELAKRSIEIAPILEVGRTDIIIRLLEENDCISYLPDFTTEKQVREGSLVYLDVGDVKTEIWKQLIHHRDKWLSNAMQAFLSYVKTHEFDEHA